MPAIQETDEELNKQEQDVVDLTNSAVSEVNFNNLKDDQNFDSLVNNLKDNSPQNLDDTEELPVIDEEKLNKKPGFFETKRAERTSREFDDLKVPESVDEKGKEYKFTPEEVRDMLLYAQYPELKAYSIEFEERLRTIKNENGVTSDEYKHALEARKALNRNMDARKLSDVKNLDPLEKKHYLFGLNSAPLSDKALNELAEMIFSATKEAGMYHADSEDEKEMIEHIKDNLSYMNNHGMSGLLRSSYEGYSNPKLRTKIIKGLQKNSDDINYSDAINDRKYNQERIEQITRNATNTVEGVKSSRAESQQEPEPVIESQPEEPDSEPQKNESAKIDPYKTKATEKQKETLRRMNIHFRDNITIAQASNLMEEAGVGKSKFLKEIYLVDPNTKGVEPNSKKEREEYLKKTIVLFRDVADKLDRVDFNEEGRSVNGDLFPAQLFKQFSEEDGYALHPANTYSRKDKTHILTCSIGTGRLSRLNIGNPYNAREISEKLRQFADKYQKNLDQLNRISQTEKQTQTQSQTIKDHSESSHISMK